MGYRTPAALAMAVKEAARRSSMDTGRAIESFYYHRFLCRVFSVSDSKFALKGGRGVLARTSRARYSRDVDFSVCEMSIDEAIAELTRLASMEMDDFIVFELLDVKPIRSEDDYRDGVRLIFATHMGAKQLQPLTVDLVVDQIPCEEIEVIVPVDRLDVGQLTVLDYRVVSAPYALADKFCAILEKHGERASSRVKDLIDILVYLEMGDVDINSFIVKLKREAKARRIDLPHRFAIPDIWFEHYSGAYAKMISEVELDTVYPSLAEGAEAAARFFEAAMSGTSIR